MKCGQNNRNNNIIFEGLKKWGSVDSNLGIYLSIANFILIPDALSKKKLYPDANL